MTAHPSDEDLLRLMLGGCAESFAALYDRRQAGVYRFALRMTGSEAFAEDVTQDVSLRAPYFHTGRFASLEEVVDFYNRGVDFDAPNIDRNRIRPLGLSAQQRADLVAFLRGALTDPRVAAGAAPFDRPMLYTESTRVPALTGAGTPGTGGNVSLMTAVGPPVVGNPSFTVAVSNALGGAQAVLVVDGQDPGTGPNVPSAGSLARVGVQLSGGGAAGREAALKRVAESDSPTRAEFNPSFVLMEYFGYLRRDPDEAGYNFWLAKLNQFGGDFQRAEMVKAFLASAEYRARFPAQ